MSPPSKLRKIEPTSTDVSDQSETDFPPLPDDLLLMIFGELTSVERAPLGTSCKRFREIDFEVGKKLFDVIDIELNRLSFSVSGKTPHTNYNIAVIPPQLNNHQMRLFRKAKSDTLNINIKPWAWFNYSDIDSTDFDYVMDYLRARRSNKIRAEIKSAPIYMERFIQTLITNNTTEKPQLALTVIMKEHERDWKSRNNGVKNALAMMRNVTKLRLDWRIDTNLAPENPTSKNDDAFFLHIVSAWAHAELNKLRCTAKALLKAFEIIRRSEVYKFFKLYVPTSCTDGLLSNTHGYRTHSQAGWHYLIDYSTNTVLYGHPQNNLQFEGYSEIMIGKMDEHWNLRIENLNWP